MRWPLRTPSSLLGACPALTCTVDLDVMSILASPLLREIGPASGHSQQKQVSWSCPKCQNSRPSYVIAGWSGAGASLSLPQPYFTVLRRLRPRRDPHASFLFCEAHVTMWEGPTTGAAGFSHVPSTQIASYSEAQVGTICAQCMQPWPSTLIHIDPESLSMHMCRQPRYKRNKGLGPSFQGKSCPLRAVWCRPDV